MQPTKTSQPSFYDDKSVTCKNNKYPIGKWVFEKDDWKWENVWKIVSIKVAKVKINIKPKPFRQIINKR